MFNKRKKVPAASGSGMDPALEELLSRLDGRDRKLLREELLKYRLVVERTHDMVCMTDLTGHYIYVSPSNTKTLGYAPEDLLGKAAVDLIHPDDRVSLLKTLRRYITPSGKKAINKNDEDISEYFQYRFKSASGEWRHLETTGNFLGDKMLFISRDITERRQAQDALQQSKEDLKKAVRERTQELQDANASLQQLTDQLKNLNENIADGMVYQISTGEDGALRRFTYLSPAVEKLHGLPYDEVVKNPSLIYSQMLESDRAEFMKREQHAIDARTKFEGAVRMQMPSGEIRWHQFVSVPRTEQGHGTVWDGLETDITDRVRREELQRMQYELILELNACDDIRQGFDTIIDTVLRLDYIDAGGMYLADPSDGSLSLIVHRGLSKEFIEHVSYYPGASSRVELIAKGRALYGNYTEVNPHADTVERREGIRAIAIIPIMSKGKMIAVLNLASHTHDSISDATRGVLETIALQIGGTLMRLRADAARSETEEIFRRFMDNSPIYVFFKDDAIRSLRLSSNYERLIGKPMHELLGKTMYDLFPSEFAKKIVADDMRVLAEGKQITLDEELNGRFYTTIKFPIHIDGKPRYLAGYTIDITDRKLAEDAVAAEKERLAITLRSIGDGVITTDTRGAILSMNKVAEELTGWMQHDARELPLTEVFTIVDKNTRERRSNPVEKVLASGGIVELADNTLLIARDGRERLIADSGAPIRDSKNTTIGVVLVFRDMTEKQEMLDNLQRMQKLDALGVLAGGIAHDFNNLLTGLSLNIDLARMRAQADSPVTAYLDKAMTRFSRAKGLTQQLLTFAKGGAPIRKTGRLEPIIRDNVLFALSGSNVSCTFTVAADLWTCDFDEAQIGQVIDNIVINAKQAMPAGGTISVTAGNEMLSAGFIAQLPAGAYVRLSIKDHGAGIPAGIKNRIFDPFFTTKEQGNGLGLTTSYSIIRKHDGLITVESEPGKGSTFHILLPASRKPLAATDTMNAQEQISGYFLIMDDDKDIRTDLMESLKALNCTVVTAGDGREALACIARAQAAGHMFDAVFLDFTVAGGMGGIETVCEIRKTHPMLPVFVMSGYADDPVLSNPAAFHFSGGLQKPFVISDMLEIYRAHKK
ncbi:MAG: PAS domain S-box protein [Spirochaetes bacterium]|nr:PAS domain S-box protein [Spirochaetota bacterium]